MAKKIGVLLFLFVAFYLGAHFYIREKNSVPVEVPRLVTCDSNQVRAIHLDEAEGAVLTHLEFRRTDTPTPGMPPAAQLAFAEWEFAKPSTLEADAAALTRLASVFCDLYDSSVPAGEELGTSPERARVLEIVVNTPEGEKTHRLEFGKINDDHAETVAYLPPGGGAKTFAEGEARRTFTRVPPKLLQLASLPPKSFENLHVLRMPSDLVLTAALLNPGGRERFTLERVGADWSVSAGGKAMGPGTEEADKFVNRLGTLLALSAEARAAGPCPKTPRKLTLQLRGIGNREEEISFDYDKSGDLRVCNDARPALFHVSRDLLPYLDVNAESLVEKKAP